MPKYDELRTTAFRLRPNGIERLDGNYWALSFPRAWIDPIIDLQQSADLRRRSVPIASLNRAIRALVPDVSAVGRGVGRRDHPGDWLYSATPPPADALRPILHAWLCSVVGGKHAEQAGDLWARLPKEDFVWRPVDRDGLGWPSGEGPAADTVAATEHIAALPTTMYSLVPEILAAELLRRIDRPKDFPSGFRRCSTADGRGVELISWPPLESVDRRGTAWPYSYRVRLTVQTVPFQPEPVLHVSIGNRRWCPKTPLTRGQSVSAYVLSKVPWLDGMPESRGFRVAPMRWRSTAGTRGLGWHRELHHLFDHIEFDTVSVDPAKLSGDPLAYLGDPDSAAALVYSTRAGFTHRVGSGVSARDRDRVRTWVQDALADVIEPVAPLPQVDITLPKATPAFPAQVRSRIAGALGGDPLRVEIHWDTEAVRAAVKEAVLADLGLDRDAGHSSALGTVWSTDDGLVVRLQERPIGAWAAPLEVDESIRDRQTRKRRAAKPRIDETAHALGAATGTVAFVELRDRDAFPVAGTDPKAALRIGFATAGRLTQFLTPAPPMPEDDGRAQAWRRALAERAMSSWRDLRRQLVGSIRAVRPAVNKLELPHPADSMAVYLLRRNATDHGWADRHRLPVAVWTSSDSPKVWARTVGDQQWQPYDRFLRDLATGRAFRLPEAGDQVIRNFIREVVTSARSDRPTVLMTWSQNLRLQWPELQNSRAVVDVLAVDGTALTDLAPQVRHIMIRTSDYDETPQAYGETVDRIGLPSGLFRYPGSSRVFASIAAKPNSAKTLGGPMGTRAEDPLDDRGRSMLDRRPMFNQQFLELTVAVARPDDDLVTWAAFAHAQRKLSDTYGDMLRFPIALQLAMQATEYAIPDAGDEGFESEPADGLAEDVLD